MRSHLDNDRLDWQQLRALIKIYLINSFRATLDANTGKVKDRPYIIFFTTLFLGFTFIGNRSVYRDFYSYTTILFASVFGMATFSILPDTLDIRRRDIDIIHTKPISHKTLLTADIIQTFILASLITTAYLILPLIAAKNLYQREWHEVIALYIIALFGTFTSTVLWQALILTASQKFDLNKLRFMSQFFLILTLLPTFILNFFLKSIIRGQLSIKDYPIIKSIPSTWYVDTILGDGSTAIHMERIIVYGLYLLAIVSLRHNFALQYQNFKDVLADQNPGVSKPTVTLRLLSWFNSISIGGKKLIDDQTYSLSRLIQTVLSREEHSRFVNLQHNFFMIIFTVAGLISKDYNLIVLFITMFSFMSLITACESLKCSSSAVASWIFYTTPLDGRVVYRSIRNIVAIRSQILPVMLLVPTLLATQPLSLALFSIMLYLVIISIIPSILIMWKPRLPLSIDKKMAPGILLSIIGSYIFMFIGYVIYFFAFFIIIILKVPGIIISFTFLAAIYAISYWIKSAACNRITRMLSGGEI